MDKEKKKLARQKKTKQAYKNVTGGKLNLKGKMAPTIDKKKYVLLLYLHLLYIMSSFIFLILHVHSFSFRVSTSLFILFDCHDTTRPICPHGPRLKKTVLRLFYAAARLLRPS